MPHVQAAGNTDVADAYRRLRDAILSGELEPGAVLTQATLTDRLGIGRTPLREALRLVQRERLIVAEPNRRIRIAGLDAGDAEQLYLMRIALEAVAVRLTVPRLGSADVADLEGRIAQMEHYVRERDAWGLREPHRAFHALLVRAAGPRVAEEIALLSDHAERYRLHLGAAGTAPWDERRAEHRAIADAAAARDGERAARLLVEHYARAAAAVVAELGGADDPERVATAAAVAASQHGDRPGRRAGGAGERQRRR